MKKFLILLALLLLPLSANAYDNEALTQDMLHQKRINDMGVHILNTNKIDKKIMFTYSKKDDAGLFDDPTITKRQIIFYGRYYKYVENDDELAAFLSREISRAVKSFSGEWGGLIGATQVKSAPKKYEIFADKRAVDYMVKAGYNPLGLITFISKTTPDGMFPELTHNPISKRMAIVYEYICFNYPEYVKNNTYLDNKNYQNFLLTSRHNRAMLRQKIQTNSKKEIKYE